MAARSSRNNTLAGLFVLAAIALGVGLVIVLSNVGDRLRPRKDYVVRFSVADGAEGLDKGAPVKVGGKRVGQVTSTAFHANEVTGEPQYIDVGVSIDATLKLYRDADVQLVRPLLGSGSSINIAAFSARRRAGVDDEAGPQPLVELQPGDVIEGHPGPPAFLAQSDYAKVQNIIDRVDRITAVAAPQVDAMLADARAAVANVREVTDDVKARWPGWGAQADDVIRRVHDASAGFEDIVAKVRSGADALNAGVADARAVVNKASAAFDEYKPSIDRAVQNVRELTDKVNGEMYREVMDAVAKAKVGVADAAATLRDARELLERNAPQLDELVANANLAAQQLKLTTVEVRAAPWRLLYQPTKKELENEYLYNSVRQYSEAVGELRQAAEALRAVSARAAEARAAGRDIDQASIDRLTAKLQDAFAQYQEQERRFLQRWTEGTGK